MKYLFNNHYYDTIQEAEDAVFAYAEEAYDDMLDECYEEVSICGLTYEPSIALYRVDPVAYRVGISDFADALLSEIKEV